MTTRGLLLFVAVALLAGAALPGAPHAPRARAVVRAAEEPAGALQADPTPADPTAPANEGRTAASPVFAHITWEHRPADLGERVRLHDPDRPLLAGYRPLQEPPHVNGIPLQDVTYWYYEGRLARIHVTAAGGDREQTSAALLEHLSSLHGRPFHETLEGPAHRWVSGNARIVVAEGEPDRVSVAVEHRDRMAEAEAAAAALDPDTRLAQWLADLERHATPIRYRDLVGSPGLHEGRAVRYRGRVIQAVDARRWRIGVVDRGTIGAGNVVYVIYAGPGDPMVGPDTAVEFLGLARGLYTYRSPLGTEVTVPEIHAYRVTALP